MAIKAFYYILESYNSEAVIVYFSLYLRNVCVQQQVLICSENFSPTIFGQVKCTRAVERTTPMQPLNPWSKRIPGVQSGAPWWPDDFIKWKGTCEIDLCFSVHLAFTGSSVKRSCACCLSWNGTCCPTSLYSLTLYSRERQLATQGPHPAPEY